MAKLVVIDGPDRGKEFILDDLKDGSHLAGRDPRHPIAIADTTVSREHFRIERSRRSFRLIDLGSRNRTYLNSTPIRDAQLKPGDVIAVGDSELRFEDDAEPMEIEGMGSTIIKEVSSHSGDSITRMVDSLKKAPELKDERLHVAIGRLQQLFTLSREISRTTSLDDLYRKLLEILVPALAADSGVVMQRAGGSWAPRATLQVQEDSSSSLILVSDTVIRRVAEEQKAILCANTSSDRRFSEGESILQGNITTVVAAPISVAITGGFRVVGVLYADRRGARSPFSDEELHLLNAAAEQAGEFVALIESASELRADNQNLIRSLADSKRIIGKSRAVQEVLEFIRKAAPAPMTVLIRGETGTGKELVASAIHYQSSRRAKPFITVNCAALPENLIESELFGYEKGAFTGASARKKGRFELAHTGTIFLDEIGELSPPCQAKLLRLLEERRFERVGGTQQVEVDVRIITATNKNLGKAIETGEFREDLFYRLNVLAINLPPLRDHRDDIPMLVRHFLNELGYPTDKKMLSPEAEHKLMEYGWPGNIRQLRNVIESAVVLGEGQFLRPEALVLPEGGGGTPGGKPAKAGEAAWVPETLEEVEKKHILKALESTGGNKKKTAELLGIERCTLYAKLKSYGVLSSE